MNTCKNVYPIIKFQKSIKQILHYMDDMTPQRCTKLHKVSIEDVNTCLQSLCQRPSNVLTGFFIFIMISDISYNSASASFHVETYMQCIVASFRNGCASALHMKGPAFCVFTSPFEKYIRNYRWMVLMLAFSNQNCTKSTKDLVMQHALLRYAAHGVCTHVIVH